MNAAILTDLAEKSRTEPIYPNDMFPPSMYYRFLKLLAEEVKPTLSVELGVSGGGGSLHMALGYPKGKVVGVDFQWDHEERINYIIEKYPNFEFLLHDSKTAAQGIVDEYGKIDILFIDTDHTYDSTVAEYKAWKDHMKKGGIMLFDDLFRPGMEDAWNEVEGQKLRFDFLHDGTYPHGGGFGVLIV